MKKNKEQLINNIIGQLEGIKKMMGEGERDCFEVLIQLKAAKSAFNRVTVDFLQDSFTECAMKKSDQDKERFRKLLEELVKQ